MIQDVYVDLLFLINFSMDYLCLYICAKITHRKMKLPKMLISSTIGGIYSVVSLFLPTQALISLMIDALICVIMCAVVFSEKSRKLTSTLLSSFLFIGISMMTGGCMTAIFNLLNRLDLPLDNIDSDGISTYLFAILAAVAGIISLRSGEIISHRSAVKDLQLTVTLSGKTLTVSALSDSGNLVKDPINGKRVIIVDRNELAKITDIKVFDDVISGTIPELTTLKGLRVIPIKTAGGRSLLTACIPDKLTAEIVTKKGKEVKIELDALISPSDIKKTAEGYGAIVPSEIIKI